MSDFNGAVWAGLGSALNPLFTIGTKQIAKFLGLPHYAQVKGYENAEEVADDLIAKWEAGDRRPIVLCGHSNGGLAALRAGKKLHSRKIPHTLIIMDLTIKRGPYVSHSAKIVRHFEGRLSGISLLNDLNFVKGWSGDFKHKWVTSTHVRVPRHKDVQAEIQAVANQLRKSPKPQEHPPMPKELEQLNDELMVILDPGRETPMRKAFYEAFFTDIRPMMGGLSQDQINGLKRLLWVWDKFLDDQPDEYLAATLGYIAVETGKRMQPIRETNAATDERAVAILEGWWKSGKAQRFGVRSKYWAKNNVGFPFGRGDIQKTHHANYQKGRATVKEMFGIDIPFDRDYSLALDPVASALSAYGGCLAGTFTGKKLSDYWNGRSFDYINSRDIVNGDKNNRTHDMDRDGRVERIGEEIEGMALAFLSAVREGQKAAAKVPQDAPLPVPVPDRLPEPIPEYQVLVDADLLQEQVAELFPGAESKSVQDMAMLGVTMALTLDMLRNRPRETSEDTGSFSSFATPTYAGQIPGKDFDMNETKSPLQSSGIMGPAIALVSAIILLFTGVEVTADTQAQFEQIATILLGGSAGVAMLGRHNAKERIESLQGVFGDWGSGGSLLTIGTSLAAAYFGIDVNGTVQDQSSTLLLSGGGLVGGIIGLLGNLYRSRRLKKD